MSNVIDSFRDEYFFLSNMFDVPVVYWGGYGSKTKKTFDNNESAFQAQKSTNPDDIDKFIGIPGKRAKYLGKRVPLRPDWNQVKEQVMYEICLAKFTQHEFLREALLATGDSELIEGNTWRDYFWGVCNGKGQNKLGQILMRIRSELKSQK